MKRVAELKLDGDGEGIVVFAGVPIRLFCREVKGTRCILPANENPLVDWDQCRMGHLEYHIGMNRIQRCHKKASLR